MPESRLAVDPLPPLDLRTDSPASRRIFLRRMGELALGVWGAGIIGCAGGPGEVEEGSALLPASADPLPTEDAAELVREYLPVPDLGDDRVMRVVAGIRPYRQGGVRIALDALPDGRPLVHDYGHGGAGITLAWGSAEEVGDLLEPVLDPPAEVAVLGAGIVGMTAAWVLLERGYRVTIHAERFTPETTSDVAGGQFAPALVGIGRSRAARERFKRILRRSHRRYAMQVGARYGVHRRDNYTTGGGGSGLARIPAGILPPAEVLARLPFPGAPRRGRRYLTFLIEPPVYLPRLLRDLESLGVERAHTRFTSLEEIEGLPARAVVNCLGLGAGALFRPPRGDRHRLRPRRGALHRRRRGRRAGHLSPGLRLRRLWPPLRSARAGPLLLQQPARRVPHLSGLRPSSGAGPRARGSRSGSQPRRGRDRAFRHAVGAARAAQAAARVPRARGSDAAALREALGGGPRLGVPRRRRELARRPGLLRPPRAQALQGAGPGVDRALPALRSVSRLRGRPPSPRSALRARGRPRPRCGLAPHAGRARRLARCPRARRRRARAGRAPARRPARAGGDGDRRGSRLRDPRPPDAHPRRRRGPAHSARRGPGRNAHGLALRARRAFDRIARP